jgi:2-polyprenyl-3-methyl-5-hydroxy-6-metoxy-1,4-benzoquinol methylase
VIETNDSERSEVREVAIPVGGRHVRILAPPPEEESGSRLSCWWGLTTSAIALSRHLANMGDLASRRVIELGCGLGLAGITAGMLGAKVLFTDYMERALVFSKRNCELNGLNAANTRFRRLDWEAPDELSSFDMVLGAEVLYDYFFHGSLVRIMSSIVRPKGSIVIADRKRLVVSRFMGRLINAGFSCSETTSRVDLDGFPGQEVGIFTLERG